MARTVHIIGAGMAGLAAAVRLVKTSMRVVVHEATAHPGGRCRSYFDRAVGMAIDNGNHLVLSGNSAVLGFAQAIGSIAGLVGPRTAEFHFADLGARARWTLNIGEGMPWWVLNPRRRVPGTGLWEYLRLARLLWSREDRPVDQVITCSGPLYERLVHPLLLAALNIEPRDGSSALAAEIVRETLMRGGAACRPLIARDGLGKVFIEPAIHHLRWHEAAVRLEHELRALRFDGNRVVELQFVQNIVRLGPDDVVLIAVPPYAASALVPGLYAPSEYRSIVNAHFRIQAPPEVPPMTGVINGTVEWLFAFPGRLSVTISNGDRLLDVPRADLAQTIWNEVAAIAGIDAPLPPWQIVRERRATFAATPEQNARRPGPVTEWDNLFLAGDWTATGLPATLESAVRSGHLAADLITRLPEAA
jgi:squalene-associated FAD-dependent desaturase